MAPELPDELWSRLYREGCSRLLATLVRRFGDLELAEDVVRDGAGHIVMHLKEVPTPRVDKAIAVVREFAKANKVTLVAGTAAAARIGRVHHTVLHWGLRLPDAGILRSRLSVHDAATSALTPLTAADLHRTPPQLIGRTPTGIAPDEPRSYALPNQLSALSLSPTDPRTSTPTTPPKPPNPHQQGVLLRRYDTTEE